LASEFPSQRRKRILLAVGALLLLLIGLLLLRILTAWRPAEWRRFDGMPEETLERYVGMAEDTLDDWLEKINRKDGRPYEVAFTQSQLNACIRQALQEGGDLPQGVQESFREAFISLRPGTLSISLTSGWLGIGTVTVAVQPHVTAAGDVYVDFQYAKLGVFRIPRSLALRCLGDVSTGTKIEGLFTGKEIDPGHVCTYFIAIQIDSIQVGDAELALKGHIK